MVVSVRPEGSPEGRRLGVEVVMEVGKTPTLYNRSDSQQVDEMARIIMRW